MVHTVSEFVENGSRIGYEARHLILVVGFSGGAKSGDRWVMSTAVGVYESVAYTLLMPYARVTDVAVEQVKVPATKRRRRLAMSWFKSAKGTHK